MRLVVALALLLLTAPAHAATLASFTYTDGITRPAGAPPPPYRYGLTTGPDTNPAPGVCVGCEPVIDGWLFDAFFTAPGVFVADASDPDFAAVAARLTNGDADLFWIGFPEISYAAHPEFTRLGGHDLAGATLERIVLSIDAFRFDASAPIQTLLTATVSVEGQVAGVPAPWGLGLLALGLPFLRRR